MAVRREVKDQFMVGPSLLVAPLFAGEEERQVVLPQGKWYDFYTGKYVGEGEVITVKPGLDKIPVYVKDGGIIPLWPKLTKVDAEKHRLKSGIMERNHQFMNSMMMMVRHTIMRKESIYESQLK